MKLEDSRLTFEILHYVKELVVNVRLAREGDFDLVQVAEGILKAFSMRHMLRKKESSRGTPEHYCNATDHSRCGC